MIKMSILGERLKEQRGKKGWTKTYVARKLGYKTVSTYANWEYGIRDPDTETLARIADIFEVTTDYLTGRNEVIRGKNADEIKALEEVNELLKEHNLELTSPEFLYLLKKTIEIKGIMTGIDRK